MVKNLLKKSRWHYHLGDHEIRLLNEIEIHQKGNIIFVIKILQVLFENTLKQGIAFDLYRFLIQIFKMQLKD
jgi:hypothetical protein